MRSFYPAILLVLFGSVSYGQFRTKAKTDTTGKAAAVAAFETTLSHATEEFNAGRFYGIPSLLKDGLEGKITEEQQVRAYLLLCQAYLIIDDPLAADDNYIKLLRADPEYIATPDKDEIDIVYLSKKFTSRPIFTPHLRIGGNITSTSVIYELSTSPTPVKSSFKLRPGAQLGGGVDWNISDNVSFGGEFLMAIKSYKKVYSGYFGRDEGTEIQKFTSFDIPFMIKFLDATGQYRPYGYAGYAVNVIISSKAELTNDNKSLGQTGESNLPTTGPDENLRYTRKLITGSLVLGGGVRYKFGRDFLFFDVRLMAGLQNITNDNNYYSDRSQTQLNRTIHTYNSIVDFMRLNNLSFSVGYVKPLYYPRKLRKDKIQELLDHLIKQKEN